MRDGGINGVKITFDESAKPVMTPRVAWNATSA